MEVGSRGFIVHVSRLVVGERAATALAQVWHGSYLDYPFREYDSDEDDGQYEPSESDVTNVGPWHDEPDVTNVSPWQDEPDEESEPRTASAEPEGEPEPEHPGYPVRFSC
jgi:hypothetical protein